MPAIHPELQRVFDWIDAQRAECIADLQRLVQQPSVSAQNVGLPECSDLVVEMMHADGLDARAYPTPGGPPCVIGHVPSGSSDRTLLAYAHYDVQPVEPVEKWTYPPYSATIAAGRLWGRGATDNKSGVLAFTKAVERLEQHLVRHGFAHIEVILHAGLPEPPYKISVKEDISQAIIAAATLVFGAPPVINGVSAEGTILKHVWMPTVGCPLLDAHCPDRLCPARL